METRTAGGDVSGDVSWAPQFFAARPHLLFALGFDEYRVLTKSSTEDTAILGSYGVGYDSIDFSVESIYRDERSGAWCFLDSISQEDGAEAAIHLLGPGPTRRSVGTTTWIEQLRQLAAHPGDSLRGVWLQGLWTPAVQQQQITRLTKACERVLTGIACGNANLRSIHWRDLEELVAELLRSRGMKVYVTPRSHDDGRDIIARGELIPGEFSEIAIEVKQKSCVGLHDVRAALYANRNYPALMVATTGRFSAGVVRERQLAENRLRLFLKDGVALSQWIDVYRGTNRTV